MPPPRPPFTSARPSGPDFSQAMKMFPSPSILSCSFAPPRRFALPLSRLRSKDPRLRRSSQKHLASALGPYSIRRIQRPSCQQEGDSPPVPEVSKPLSRKVTLPGFGYPLSASFNARSRESLFQLSTLLGFALQSFPPTRESTEGFPSVSPLVRSLAKPLRTSQRRFSGFIPPDQPYPFWLPKLLTRVGALALLGFPASQALSR